MTQQDTGVQPETGDEGKSLENNANVTPAPVPSGNVGESEAEKLRKELEKVNMERNMLRNKLDETAAEQAAREKRELEEKEEFRTLYEQEKSAREAMESEVKERERKAEISAASEQIFADYEDGVVELARDAGLSLEDASEEAKAKLKAKLDKFADKIQSKSSPTPTNPNTGTAPTGVQKRQEALNQYIQSGRSEDAFAELAKTIPSVKQITDEFQS